MSSDLSSESGQQESQRAKSSMPVGTLNPVRRGFWKSLKDRLWGYDFFISYHWASGGTYAVNLAQRLRERNYDVFLDRADYASGDDWKAIGEIALRNTQRLVLIATREAVTISKPVEHEIAIFTARHRQVISIVFGDKFEDLDRSHYLTLNRMSDSQLYIEDGKETLDSGPSEKTVAELTRTQGVMRRRNLRALLTLIPAIAVIAFAAFATVSWGNAVLSEWDAIQSADKEKQAKKEAQNELAHAQFALGRVPFEQGRVEEALLWWAKSGSTANETAWRESMANLIGPWAASLPQRFEVENGVGSVAFDRNMTRVLVAGGKTVRIWDLATGRLVDEHLHCSGTAAFSPDGQSVLAAHNAERTGDNAEILVWPTPRPGRPRNREEPQNLPFAGRVNGAEFSADGQLILAWGEHSARLWDTVTGREISTLSADKVLMSPDSETVVTTGFDGSVRFWDARTGAIRGTPQKHERRVLAMAFRPDGRMLVTGSEDTTARLWDSQTGEELARPLKDQQVVTQVGFSPDGLTLFTASEGRQTGENGVAKLWDVTDVAKITQRGNSLATNGNVSTFAFSPDGERLLTGSDTFWLQNAPEARQWNVRNGVPAGAPMLHDNKKISSVAFSPDGQWILTAGSDGSARIWNAESSELYGPLMQHEGFVSVAVMGTDGSRILTASKSTAFVWDASTHRPLVKPFRHHNVQKSAPQLTPDGRVLISKTGSGSPAMAISPDDEWIITGSNDKSARVWNARSGELRFPPLSFTANVSAVAWSPDASQLLTVSEDNFVRLWRADNGQPIAQPMQHAAYVQSATFSPDGRTLLTTCRDRIARLWNALTGVPLGELPHDDEIKATAFSPNGKTVVTGCGKTARFWNVRDCQVAGPPMPHEGTVSAVAFNPDSTLVATAGEDKMVRLWNVATGLPLGKPLEHTDAVARVVFSPNGESLLTAVIVRSTNKLGEARLWEVRTGQPLIEPLRHKGNITSIGFSPDGKTLLTASRDKTVQLWDARTGLARGTALQHNDQVTAASFSHDGNHVLTSSQDNAVRLWAVPSASPNDRAEIGGLMRSLEILAGMRLDPNGEARPLSFDEWMTRKAVVR